MLINKLIYRLAFPVRGFNLVSPVYFFAAQGASQGSSDGAKAKAAKKNAAKVTQTPQEKARKARQAEQAKKQQQEDLKNSVYTIKSSSANLYRNLIRRINVSKKTSRASFNDQSLQQMIEVATRQDIRLLHEAYFNFVGHFTPVSNKVIDALVSKTMSLSLLTRPVAEQNQERVFQILQNHEYLGYFPHYSVTLEAANFSVKVDKYSVFLDILKNKPLIKLDGDTVRGLFKLMTSWSDYIKLTKILASRANSEILANLSNDELLELIATRLKKIKKIELTTPSTEYKIFLQKFDKTNRNVAIAWLVIYQSASQIAEVLKTVPKDDPFIKEFVDVVGKIEEGKVSKIKEHLENSLADTEHKDIFK